VAERVEFYAQFNEGMYNVFYLHTSTTHLAELFWFQLGFFEMSATLYCR
jgi:hypothetical protein